MTERPDKAWSAEYAGQMQTRMDAEVAIAMARLGASHVIMIAFYPDADGEHVHILDAGNAPVARAELYTKLAAIVEAYEAGPPPTSMKLN